LPATDPNGRFVLDLTKYIIGPTGSITCLGGSVNVFIVDGGNPQPPDYKIGTILINDAQDSGGIYTPISLGSYIVDVTAARLNGTTKPFYIKCTIATAISVVWSMVNVSEIYATYYPQGLQ
jgi:hypothetical protein